MSSCVAKLNSFRFCHCGRHSDSMRMLIPFLNLSNQAVQRMDLLGVFLGWYRLLEDNMCLREDASRGNRSTVSSLARETIRRAQTLNRFGTDERLGFL